MACTLQPQPGTSKDLTQSCHWPIPRASTRVLALAAQWRRHGQWPSWRVLWQAIVALAGGCKTFNPSARVRRGIGLNMPPAALQQGSTSMSRARADPVRWKADSPVPEPSLWSPDGWWGATCPTACDFTGPAARSNSGAIPLRQRVSLLFADPNCWRWRWRARHAVAARAGSTLSRQLLQTQFRGAPR